MTDPVYVFKNQPAAPATLRDAIDADDTTITLSSGMGSALPAPGAGEIAVLVFDDTTREQVTYTTRTGDVLTGVTRGVGTAEGAGAATSHRAGAKVRNVVPAAFLNAAATAANPDALLDLLESYPVDPDTGLTIVDDTTGERIRL